MAKFSVGLGAVGFLKLEAAAKAIAASDADSVHFDIMDGVFVPRITYGARLLAELRPLIKNKKFTAHLMVAEPQKHIEDFARAGADAVALHIENKNFSRAVKEARRHKLKVFAVLQIQTPIARLKPYLGKVDGATIMCAPIGYSGKPFDRRALAKIKELRRIAPSGFQISADGGIDLKNGLEVVVAGATELISGSAVWQGRDLAAAVQRFRALRA